jgi:glutamine amidotransferase
MKVVIIKYNAGNIQSVLFALERIGIQATVTDDAETIRSADKVIFPGVGEASSAMRYLASHGLDELIRNLEQPVLGICLGMQLLCRHSEENDTACLDIIPVDVKKFTPAAERKVPQIGWNNIYDLKTNLFKDIPENSFMYQVHGYYAEDSNFTIARCDYGLKYAAAIAKNNFFGVQFHTEKSAATGERILENFIKMEM